MNTPGRDAGAAIRTRLQRLSRTQGVDFQRTLSRYANERLLHRLSISQHASQFVLKGATLFIVWTGQPHRATRDLDLLGFGLHEVDHLQDVFSEVIATKLEEDDGLRFDAETLTVAPIRESQAYGGIRVKVLARLTQARIRLQIDVGFGDVITPSPKHVELPTLLNLGATHLRTYPPETVVAEKVEALVQLGLANSRMKDFYDLRVIGLTFSFEGTVLSQAFRATFARRGTPLPVEPPLGLTSAFAKDPSKLTQWRGFARKSGATDVAPLEETIESVRNFVWSPLLGAGDATSPAGRWSPGGPWR